MESQEPPRNSARSKGMSLRLLIDECLSPDLVDLAVAAGHVESTCLRDRGLLGTQDWTLMKHVLAEDFTLVTVNAQDFRGSGEDTPGRTLRDHRAACRSRLPQLGPPHGSQRPAGLRSPSRNSPNFPT